MVMMMIEGEIGALIIFLCFFGYGIIVGYELRGGSNGFR